MTTERWLECDAILSGGTWHNSAFVGLDVSGCISEIVDRATASKSGLPCEHLRGWVFPGFINAHSHAFQYAMAGLAEHLTPGAVDDDFWSWREMMYSLALSISPDQLQALAAMLYSEMLRCGYTRVVEFHYLHHDMDGRPYDNVAEMAERLSAAAQQAGIGLTLAPMYYNTGDFGRPAQARQRRFISRGLDDYEQLLEASANTLRQLPDGVLARGVHSLRAANPADVRAIFERQKNPSPVHIHVSEQVREVERSIEVLGARPVQWLLDNVELGEHCNLVHATHLDEAETRALAASGAVAVLCSSTEGNLGDGFFELRNYTNHSGRWAIGSDSHVGLSPIEELRWLDYGRRMIDRQRNILCRAGNDDSGAIAMASALEGGRLAAGLEQADLQPGAAFDAILVDAEAPVMYAVPPDRRASALIYAADNSVIRATYRRGVPIVEAGRHKHCRDISSAYRNALAQLRPN